MLRSAALAVGLAFALLTGTAAVAEEGRDPGVTEVLEQLGSGTSEATVLRWVAAEGNAPVRVTHDDLVALKSAGASDGLLELLVALAEEAPEGDFGEILAEVEAASAAGLGAAGLGAAGFGAAGPAETAEIPIRFEIEYRPLFLADDEDPWGLYVYLDGQVLTWVSSGSQLRPSEPVRFERRLEPGLHVLRLFVENHEKRSGERWHHEARVAPEELVFLLEPGIPASVDVRIEQPRFGLGGLVGGDKGPLNVEIRQGEKLLQSLFDAGYATDQWDDLCEEIEVNLDPDKKVPRRLERELSRCVRWAEVWRSVEGEFPSREAVRDELARFAYRPLAR